MSKKGGHHGGSWKVAYADFVTAMMAFFLLMWLISALSKEQKSGLADYFTSPSELQTGGSHIVVTGTDTQPVNPGNETLPETDEYIEDVPETPPTPSEAKILETQRQQLSAELAAQIQQRLSHMKDQIIVQATSEGVRVQLMDNQSQPIFDVGSTKLTGPAQEALKVLSESLLGMTNPLVIEGHTDSLSFASDRYTNWELSTDRASTARRTLEQNGVPVDRVVRVSGFAASQPLIKEKPDDPRNRRISILILDEPPPKVK
jgi:chemotaxis protein MotB